MNAQNVSSGNLGTVNTSIYNESSASMYNESSATVYNGSSATIYNGSTTEDTRYSVLITYGITLVAICSILCSSFALNIIHRCRKLSIQIRFVSKNLLASYILFESTIVLLNLAMLLMGDEYYKQIFSSRTFFTSAFVLTLWGSLCAVTIERLLALTMPLHYRRYVTKTVLSISISSLWTANILVPAIVFVITGIKSCGYDYISCDIDALFLPVGLVIVSFLILYSLVVVISYVKISFIISQHNQLGKTLNANTKYLADISQKQKLTDSTKTVAVVILTFIVFQSPLYFHCILFNLIPALRQYKWRMLFQLVDYLGVELNTYVTLYLYIWKFKECKMHFFYILSKFNKKFKATADALHIDVFNIVITDYKHRKIAQMKDSKL